MHFLPRKKLSLTIALLVGATSSVQALTVDELAAQFEAYKKQQNVRFNQLSQENQTLKQQNQELKSQMDSTQQQVENNTEGVESVSESYDGVSSVAQWFDKTSIGGYGELHYQNRSTENGGHKEEVDFHRFVLFLVMSLRIIFDSFLSLSWNTQLQVMVKKAKSNWSKLMWNMILPRMLQQRQVYF